MNEYIECPVLTHSESSHQFSDLGIPLDKSDLVQVRVNINPKKISVVIPRGDSACRLILPGTPLRIEISFDTLANALNHGFVRLPVPFSEAVAMQYVDIDNLSEFITQPESDTPEQFESTSEIRVIDLLINPANIAHYGSIDGKTSHMVVVGMPQPIPINLSSEEITTRLNKLSWHKFEPSVSVSLCPVGWGIHPTT